MCDRIHNVFTKLLLSENSNENVYRAVNLIIYEGFQVLVVNIPSCQKSFNPIATITIRNTFSISYETQKFSVFSFSRKTKHFITLMSYQSSFLQIFGNVYIIMHPKHFRVLRHREFLESTH